MTAITKKKRILFAMAATTLALVLSVAGLLALDVYEHHKLSTSGGLNVWGYRGPTVGRKKAGERRIVVVGGSTAFGYGVTWQQAFPAYLQDLVNAKEAGTGKPVTIVNLAYNNEGAHSFQFTLKDYAYLDYDAVIFYSGYNDLGANLSVYRRTSPIYRLTGYMPILPLVLREKSMVIRYGGNLDAAYRNGRNVYRPNVAQRATATTLASVADVMYSFDRPQNSEGEELDPATLADGAPCGPKWAHYCGSMYIAMKYALDRNTRVLMVTQPRSRERPGDHMEQQERLVAFLQSRFPGNPLLRFTSLIDAVNLADPAICYDGLHLKPEGNRVIAERLVEPVLEMIR